MIVPMEKLTLIMPSGDCIEAVSALRDLGVMHVEELTLPEAAERTNLEENLTGIARYSSMLAPFRNKENPQPSNLSGAELLNAVSNAFSEKQRLERELDACERTAAELEQWGDFEPSQITKLRERGIYLTLCMASLKEMEALREKGFVCHELSSAGSMRRFAVITDREIAPDDNLPEVKLSSDRSLSAVYSEIKGIRSGIGQINSSLRSFADTLPELEKFRLVLEETLEFAVVRDTVQSHGELATLTGFVPVPEMEKAKELARKHGWGIFTTAPDPEQEKVPTLLKQSKVAKLINPLMEFLSIAPGYDERDVSMPILIFFTIFFGMLVGDAGYGMIFLTAFGALLIAKHHDRKLRPVLTLLVILGLSAVIWGVMTSNYFGMSLFPGIHALTEDPAKDRNVQLICFSLALIQLALAHLLRIIAAWNDWRNVSGNIGWLLVLAGNFLMVVNLLLIPGFFPMSAVGSCYIAGILLAGAGDVDWKDAGSIFGFPFGIIGSFVDVLSYIRLFAVGMAGYYLAVCFNDMAKPMFENPYTIVFGVIVLLIGHLLNLALASMSVLVHGVRLNTLEFSSHLGLRWAGVVFSPFRKKSTEQ